MIEESRIKVAFDIVIKKQFQAHPKPTKESISHINEHFGIRLPELLVELAFESESFSSWFPSLGDNYEDLSHIIRINALYRNKRIRRNGKWGYAMPRDFVILNLAFDQDCDCLDTSNLVNGEYIIKYWYPNMEEPPKIIGENFEDYITRNIQFWSKNLKGEKLKKYQNATQT